MRFGGMAALTALALSLGPSVALTADPALSPARCAAAEFAAYDEEADPKGQAYLRIEIWRALAIDEPDGTNRFIEATTIFTADASEAKADVARCAAVDPLTFTPPMPDNPDGDYRSCVTRVREAQQIAAEALSDFQARGDGGALRRQLAQADALLMAHRAEMAGGKSTCSRPLEGWVEAGDQALRNRMRAVGLAMTTGNTCKDFEGQRSASL